MIDLRVSTQLADMQLKLYKLGFAYLLVSKPLNYDQINYYIHELISEYKHLDHPTIHTSWYMHCFSSINYQQLLVSFKCREVFAEFILRYGNDFMSVNHAA